VGFEGLGIPNGQGILMVEDAISFANAVIAILDSEELRNKMGLMGGNHVRQTFAWNAIANQLLNYFNNQKS
jgi:glycosyltransferase involved in cell wall biosynthesis